MVGNGIHTLSEEYGTLTNNLLRLTLTVVVDLSALNYSIDYNIIIDYSIL